MRNKILTLFKPLIFMVAFICFAQKSSLAEEDLFKFSINGEYGQYHTPKRSYLGTQDGGAAPVIFNLIRPENDALLRTVQFGFENKFSHKSDITLSTSVGLGRASQSDNIGLIDSNGDTLIIGGTASGTSFALPDGGIGASNRVSNAKYKFDYQFYEATTQIRKKLRTKNNQLSLVPFAGLSYRYSNIEDRFGGDITDFLARFENNTDIKVQSLSPTIGTSINFALTPSITFLNDIHYAYNLNRGRGADTLEFTGQTTQTEKLKNNNATHSYGVSTGFDFKMNDALSVGIIGKYESLGNAPQMKLRDNLQESDFDYERADIFSGSVKLSFKF